MFDKPITRRTAISVIGSSLGIGAGSASRTGRSRPAITLDQNNGDAELRADPTYCRVSAGLLDEMGAKVGEQIRVGCADCTSGYESGLYTVLGTVSSKRTIQMGKDGLDRIGGKNNASGFARAYAPHPDYETRAEADENDEYVEILRDDGEESDLVACAVHGGWIEYRTDRQSAHVADALDATEWSCAGYNSGGGAYDRWHVASTDVDRRAFPGLDRIADREFSHAVSFHGFSGDGIAVGGGAPEGLRTGVRDEIRVATDGAYDVYLADEDGPYAGNSPENFVNWLTEDGNGLQIEQEWDARVDDWETVADAVARVYDDVT